jgi:hypothetical protein
MKLDRYHREELQAAYEQGYHEMSDHTSRRVHGRDGDDGGACRAERRDLRGVGGGV